MFTPMIDVGVTTYTVRVVLWFKLRFLISTTSNWYVCFTNNYSSRRYRMVQVSKEHTRRGMLSLADASDGERRQPPIRLHISQKALSRPCSTLITRHTQNPRLGTATVQYECCMYVLFHQILPLISCLQISQPSGFIRHNHRNIR